LKQVQNFYFLRNCSGILWWWKRPFSSWRNSRRQLYVRLWTGMLLKKSWDKNTNALEKTRKFRKTILL
jgi:hypothetical protein